MHFFYAIQMKNIHTRKSSSTALYTSLNFTAQNKVEEDVKKAMKKKLSRANLISSKNERKEAFRSTLIRLLGLEKVF